MPQDHSTALLTGWEGYTVRSGQRIHPQGTGPARMEIHLVRTKPTFRCSGCGQERPQVHEVPRRCVRDLPILDAQTYVWVPRYRVACPTCGPKVEALPWLSPWARVTTRLAESVVRLCQVLPIQHVAEWYALDWATVKALDKAALTARLLPVDLSGIEVIALR